MTYLEKSIENYKEALSAYGEYMESLRTFSNRSVTQSNRAKWRELVQRNKEFNKYVQDNNLTHEKYSE